MTTEPRPDGGSSPRDTDAAAPRRGGKPDPRGDHITNGAEATNLPSETDLQPLTPDAVDPKIAQAKKDLDAGQVDTDLRETPGLDAQRRKRLTDAER